LASRTASCLARAVDIDGANDQSFVAGSYSSALASTLPETSLNAWSPPTTRTRPSGNNVAVWKERGVCMLEICDQVLVSGSYSSALELEPRWKPSAWEPPTTRTFPF